MFTDGNSAVDVSIISRELNQPSTVQHGDPQLTYIQPLTRHINIKSRCRHGLTSVYHGSCGEEWLITQLVGRQSMFLAYRLTYLHRNDMHNNTARLCISSYQQVIWRTLSWQHYHFGLGLH